MKESIGQFLAVLRRANGYTQQEVADKLGISNRTLSGWERGAALPDILLLPALAELYGVTVDEILRGERAQTPLPALSRRAYEDIFKSKYARFSMWAYILAGVFVLGVLLFSLGCFFSVIANYFNFLLLIGLVVSIFCAIALFAMWRGYENAAEEQSYISKLRRCVSVCCSIAAASLALSCIFFVVICLAERVSLFVALVDFVFAVTFLVFAIVLKRRPAQSAEGGCEGVDLGDDVQ